MFHYITITSWWFFLNGGTWRVEWLYRRMRNMPHISSLDFLHVDMLPPAFCQDKLLFELLLPIPFEKWSGLGFFYSFYKSKNFPQFRYLVRLLMKSFFHCCGSKVGKPGAMAISSYLGPEKHLACWKRGEEAKANVSMCAKTLQQTQEMRDAASFVVVSSTLNTAVLCLDPHWSQKSSKVLFLFFSMHGTNEKWRNCQRVQEISLFRLSSLLQTSWNTPVQCTNIKFQNENSIGIKRIYCKAM